MKFKSNYRQKSLDAFDDFNYPHSLCKPIFLNTLVKP